MVKNSKTYSIDTELEAALLAASTSGRPVRVKGKRIHLIRLESDDIWEGYDPDDVIRVVERSAEHPYSATPSDLEDLLKDLRAAREQNSSGRPG